MFKILTCGELDETLTLVMKRFGDIVNYSCEKSIKDFYLVTIVGNQDSKQLIFNLIDKVFIACKSLAVYNVPSWVTDYIIAKLDVTPLKEIEGVILSPWLDKNSFPHYKVVYFSTEWKAFIYDVSQKNIDSIMKYKYLKYAISSHLDLIKSDYLSMLDTPSKINNVFYKIFAIQKRPILFNTHGLYGINKVYCDHQGVFYIVKAKGKAPFLIMHHTISNFSHLVLNKEKLVKVDSCQVQIDHYEWDTNFTWQLDCTAMNAKNNNASELCEWIASGEELNNLSHDYLRDANVENHLSHFDWITKNHNPEYIQYLSHANIAKGQTSTSFHEIEHSNTRKVLDKHKTVTFFSIYKIDECYKGILKSLFFEINISIKINQEEKHTLFEETNHITNKHIKTFEDKCYLKTDIIDIHLN